MKPINTFCTLTMATVFFLSCSKNEVSEPITTTCTIAKTYIYDSGQIVDSFAYTYTSDKVSRVEYGSGRYITLEYDGEKVSRRNYFEGAGTQPVSYDVISYNAGGTINKIELFNPLKGSQVQQLDSFVYNSNKLVAIRVFDKAKTERAIYEYGYTINNITSLDGKETWGGIENNFHFDLRYDNQPNFFNTNQQSLLTNGFFSTQIPVTVPYALSDNNVVELVEDGSKIPISYIQDDNKNLTEVRTLGEVLMRSTYDCK